MVEKIQFDSIQFNGWPEREREGQVRILGDFKGERIHTGGECVRRWRESNFTVVCWFGCQASAAAVDKRECWKIAHIFLLLCPGLGLGGIGGRNRIRRGARRGS